MNEVSQSIIKKSDIFNLSSDNTDKDKSFEVKAFNSDNLIEASEIVNLFKLHYGVSHPFSKVYDEKFWMLSKRNKIEPGGLISLLAYDGDKLIAHLGLDRNPETEIVQTLLPAIHPDYKALLISIIKAFSNKTYRLAKRQKWCLIFQYALTSQPMLQLLASKCFSSDAVSIIPCADTSYGFESNRHIKTETGSSLVVMYHALNPGNELTTVYIPDALQDICKDIYNAQNLKRVFSSTQRIESSHRQRSKKLSSHKLPFTLRFLRRFRLLQLRLHPTLIEDELKAINLIAKAEESANRKDKRLSIQVAIDDPKAPQLITEIQKRGYRFCGLLPLIDGRDYLVLSRFENSELTKFTLYTERSKKLRDFILNTSTLL